MLKSNPMKNQTKTFTKKTELVFTTIEIEKRFTVLRKHYYLATFNSGESEDKLTEYQISSASIETCLKRIGSFLDCEIDERHYIIK